MDQFADLPFVAWAGLAAVAFVIIVIIACRFVAKIRGRRQLISVRAKVVAKRAATHGRMSSNSPGDVYTSYFATFEMGAGERLEFHLQDADYGLLVEGDEGMLTYQG